MPPRKTQQKEIVIITGAGQGLGKAIALQLANANRELFLIGRNEKKLVATMHEVIALGGVANHYVADLSDPQQLDFVDKILKKHHHIDILINNAGWSPKLKTIERLTPREIQRCFGINIFSVFYLVRKVLPTMKHRDSGRIINISSRAGKKGYPRLAPYSSSKFALEGFTQALAKELEKTAITCYTVAPGPLRTPMRQQLFGDAATKNAPALAAAKILELIQGTIPVHSGDCIEI